MNCPVCNLPLIILELNQVEVDYCTNCLGIWLDEGELELLLEDSKEKNNLFKSFIVDRKSKENSVKCPICRKKMDKVICGEEKKVILDKCKKGHGLWFNKGELEAVVEMRSLDKQNKIVSLLREMFSYNLK
ncbi:MAG TPA: zf-TFIIB domain-containing protein [Ignavibacteriaceae bacterium]|nr:zf-TFIIB domain-containing protein [Ignavibacteriaceae bacterium]